MYIRTKDEVYEVEQSQLEDDEEVVNCDYGQIHKLEILRKSNTIEELCDLFVLEETHYMETSLQEIILYEKCIGKGLITTIKGAIWTDKGLIYVAKMNDKGELELI